MDRWRGLERLDNGSATAAGDLLRQDLCYGTTVRAELEMLEGRADLRGWWPGQVGPIPCCFFITDFISHLQPPLSRIGLGSFRLSRALWNSVKKSGDC